MRGSNPTCTVRTFPGRVIPMTKTGTSVAAQPGARHYRVSTGTVGLDLQTSVSVWQHVKLSDEIRS